MSYSETTEGRLQGALPPDLITHLERHLHEYSLPMTTGEDWLMVELAAAEIRLSRAGGAFDVTIAADSPALLHQAREQVLRMLDLVFPQGGAQIDWRGALPTGAPPNFHMATVVSVQPVGRNFLRVEMACAGTGAMSRGGMHFTLLLPPEGRAPVWPRIGERGRTIWPEDEDELHCVAYTFVTLDAAAGRFTFDIYVHDGRTCDWARTVRPGEVVAVTGPGGGDFPLGDHLLIAGDETALPAIRRILEHSDPARRGVALIEVEGPEFTLPLIAPAGIELRWIFRSEGQTLWDAIPHLDLPGAGSSRYVWVAAEKELARKAKAHFRDRMGLSRTEGYFSGYWASV